MSTDTERVRDAYDARPWPAPGTVQAPALPDHWVDMAVEHPVLRHDSRVLVAGCGTGGEVAAFASRIPDGEVVGVDISPASIEHARQAWPGLRFHVGDLAADPIHGTFDFISCHAVADYVPDAPALLRNLARALKPGGVLYLGTNSDAHPGRRIRQALGHMGIDPNRWAEHRPALKIVQAILGEHAPVRDLALQPDGLLAADVFPAFSHGADLHQWTEWADAAGLSLAGSLAAQWVVPGLGDRELPHLFGLDRAAFAVLVEELQHNPVLQLVFTNRPAPVPPWTDPELWSWRAELIPALGRQHFPALEGDWMTPRFISLGTHGLPELRMPLSAWMLELYRRSDGVLSLAEVRASMPAEAHDDHVRASLWRFWQVGLLRMRPPVTDPRS